MGIKGDLTKLFNRDYLARLDNIKQWLEYDRHQQESVSQHSFKVSVFTMSLLDYFWPTGTETNAVLTFKYRTLKLALMHDFDEAILRRDITHEVKYNAYNGMEIRYALDKFVEHQMADDFGADSEVLQTLSKTGEYYDITHAVVKVADWMALLYFLNRELSMGNRSWPLNLLPYCNDNFRKAVTTLQNACEVADVFDAVHTLYVPREAVNALQNNII
jgi:5'-deoxynucleotidase YfbR-like HD superfamily hydrolase